MTDHGSPSTTFVDPRAMTSYTAPLSPPESSSGATSQSGATPRTSTSSPKKKRKSWGQVLPEPTTSLPPRKRAKTDAEKQQRQYERVQRNRAAAHNSRMRKQNEMEDALVENNRLKQDVQGLEIEVRRLRAENARLRQQPTVKQESETVPEWNYSPILENRTPSLTSASSIDDNTSSPLLQPADNDADPFLSQDLTIPMKRTDDSHSAEDVGVADLYNGSGLGISQDMNVNLQYDLNTNEVPLFNNDNTVDFDISTNDFDFNSFIKLEGLSDSVDNSMINQNPWSNYIPGFAPQMQSSLAIDMPETLDHLQAFTTQPLF